MKILRASLVVSLTIFNSVIIVDDAFGTYRESRDTVKISQTNEYANYVHFQPEWKSYPRNLIVDVTTTWEREVVLEKKTNLILLNMVQNKDKTDFNLLTVNQ